MNLFTNLKQINIGDSVFYQYDDKKAFGIVLSIDKELIEVDYTTEQSIEPKTDKFRKGFWNKVI